MDLLQTVSDDLTLIRRKKPLVHSITNFVVMNETANAILCLGALPIMAHAVEEVEEMVGITNALVLNIGTLSPDWIDAMELAGKRANKNGHAGDSGPGRGRGDAAAHGIEQAAAGKRADIDRARQRGRGRDAGRHRLGSARRRVDLSR